MGRRTILLIVAVLIAALGSALVFLYVRGADNRATEAQAPVQVLKAVAQINAGETLAAAQAAGKLQLGTVPSSQVLTGAMSSIGSNGTEQALTPVYPNEQIISAKFGTPANSNVLPLPKGDIAISVTMSDTGRVAGFIQPGNSVAIFLAGAVGGTGGAASSGGGTGTDQVRLLLPKVEVVAIGATTVAKTTTTDTTGTQTTEQLPKTLFTLAVNQKDAEKIMFATGHGTLTFGYLNNKSKVKPGPGVSATDLFR